MREAQAPWSASCLFLLCRDQSSLRFDNVGAEAKGVAIDAANVREMLRGELSRDDVDDKLPRAGDIGDVEDEIARILGKILSDEEHLCPEKPQVLCQTEILLAPAFRVDPDSDP